jgi:flagellar biosynthesis protein FlhG
VRPLRHQDFYELLEIAPDATLAEIERAYRVARSTYHPNSIATYSVFSDEENREILRRIDEAYEILSDAGLRREYDARITREQLAETPRAASGDGGTFAAAEVAPAPYPARSPEADLELEESVEPEDGVFDGPVLRRIRLSRGVELEDISSITKINETYLRFIEENRYHDLPSAVYVRGFLLGYAKCLRLDPRRVTESYMERYRSRIGGGRDS